MWFGNHGPKKNKEEQGFKIGRAFTGERCWGLKNRSTIKDALPDIDPKSKGYVAQWNSTRKVKWEELEEDEQDPWNDMALKWNEEGPDDDVKPECVEPNVWQSLSLI